MLIVTILLGIIGTTLSSDWQAIGRDPCYENFLANFSTVRIAESQNTMVCRDFSTDNFASLCEAESSNEHNCIWNCISKVTGSSSLANIVLLSVEVMRSQSILCSFL